MPTRVSASAENTARIQEATTFLFVPGNRADRFAKARLAAPDVVVLDLEDAVARKDKATARTEVARWLSDGGRACVRVNYVNDIEHAADVDALRGLPGLAAVMIPKADAAVEYREIRRALGCPVIALIESAAGLDSARTIAADPGVARLAFGHLDYALDIGAEPTHSAMLHARSQLVLASRVATKPGPVDGVTTTLDDVVTLGEDLRHGIEIGMAGKLLIHPLQVAASRAAFQPSDSAVANALDVVAAAATASGAAVRLHGRMVDAPVLARAYATLRAAGIPTGEVDCRTLDRQTSTQ